MAIFRIGDKLNSLREFFAKSVLEDDVHFQSFRTIRQYVVKLIGFTLSATPCRLELIEIHSAIVTHYNSNI